MRKPTQKLTRAEEGLMLVLWSLEKAFLKDIVNAFPDPGPSQSTISTLLRTLERKGFVTHKAYSKTFEYYPVITKREYLKGYFGDFFQKYFGGSYEDLLWFLSQELNLELRVPEIVVVEDEEVGEEEEDDKAQLSLF